MAMELEPIEMPVAASSPARAAAATATAPGPTTSSSSDLFDLETYISRYESSSETRLQRLLLVASASQSQSAKSAPSDRMAEQAYRMAERQCRDASNVRTYRQVFGGQVAAAAAAGSGSGGKFGPLECFRFPTTHVVFCGWGCFGGQRYVPVFGTGDRRIVHVPALGDMYSLLFCYISI